MSDADLVGEIASLRAELAATKEECAGWKDRASAPTWAVPNPATDAADSDDERALQAAVDALVHVYGSGRSVLDAPAVRAALIAYRHAQTKMRCVDCGGTGTVRVHGPEDYGISFESEECERCKGSGWIKQ